MKGKHIKEICYFCGKPATTREHILPKALFPEQEYDEKKLRKNLITVPSCDEHNSRKSGDDEYFCNIMRTSIESNKIPKKTMINSMVRSVYRNPKLYYELFKNEFSISIWNGYFYQESRAYSLDMKCMKHILEHISKAIFYYERKKVSKYNYTGFNILSECIEQKEKVQAMLQLWSILEYKGENPDVFKYKMLQNDTVFLFYFVYMKEI